MTDRERRLEAPHRRLQPGSLLFERAVVAGYQAFAWLISHLPPALPRVVLGGGAQLSYLLWPTKRRWSNANFGHVLGLSPHHPRVLRTALKAYGAYGRYVVELARLPKLAREHADGLVLGANLDEVHQIWEASEGGLIFTLGHVGNAEAVAAGVASRGWPINVVADDSSYPGLFEEFRRTREQWGVHVIPWPGPAASISCRYEAGLRCMSIGFGNRACITCRVNQTGSTRIALAMASQSFGAICKGECIALANVVGARPTDAAVFSTCAGMADS